MLKLIKYLLIAALVLCPLPSVNAAGFLLLAKAAGGSGSLIFTWTDSKTLTGTPVPPASFAAASIGTASSDRIVVAGISWQGTASTNMDITAVTIGGVTATQVAYLRSSARAHGIWYAAVP